MSDNEIYEFTESASLFWVTDIDGKVTDLHIVPARDRRIDGVDDRKAKDLLLFDWHTFGPIKELHPHIHFGAQLGQLGEYVFSDKAYLCWEVNEAGRVTYLSIIPDMDSIVRPLNGHEGVLTKASQRGWVFPPLFSMPPCITWVTE